MTNLLQEISEKTKPQENDYCFYIRFMDIPDNKQEEIIKLIRLKSSIWTLRNQIDNNQIRQILTATNPIIWQISKRYLTQPFCHWIEQRLSKLIYHYWRVVFKNKKPQRNLRHYTDRLVWNK